ncbi:hypothetical protein ACFOWM_02170 [Ferruginibacter yonginensis]|uniref:DNA recombination protein RmuC n=1 Tax=Ferruginibacter yonginensis TaxID=1310416 RepID=A0ABV8QN04_9BACT
MKKSNIILALLAGAAIGGIIALAIKDKNNDIIEEQLAELEEQEVTMADKFDKIAEQFSNKISNELKAAENIIKSAVDRKKSFLHPDESSGIFL